MRWNVRYSVQMSVWVCLACLPVQEHVYSAQASAEAKQEYQRESTSQMDEIVERLKREKKSELLLFQADNRAPKKCSERVQISFEDFIHVISALNFHYAKRFGYDYYSLEETLGYRNALEGRLFMGEPWRRPENCPNAGVLLFRNSSDVLTALNGIWSRGVSYLVYLRSRVPRRARGKLQLLVCAVESKSRTVIQTEDKMRRNS
ncbi:hypothetical protein CYMTET_42802 [Cymbomonas tetramitiformis]|uniref:Uncharacterized protein n=1 Tax=Cymbomonas tetramitiformis TaxID=36881 RepID=A0AAE0C3G7_9CHLO|nr:hypothetical protein CYMTET_42802 [Cymbomonas tetramitiformis]